MANDSRTLADQAFDSIFGSILNGDLPLGGVVNEVNLAERFQISRGPVREAVRRLQGLRLVTREPYTRARVVSLRRSDVIEIFQLREAAEGMACRLAAQYMPAADTQRLADDLEQAHSAFRNGPRTAGNETPHLDVHMRIADGCGNKRIRHLLCDELYHLLRIYRARSGARPGRREQAFDEHWQIVRAIQLGDPDLAESLMRTHIRRATQSLLESKAEDDSASAPGHDRTAPDKG